MLQSGVGCGKAQETKTGNYDNVPPRTLLQHECGKSLQEDDVPLDVFLKTTRYFFQVIFLCSCLLCC